MAEEKDFGKVWEGEVDGISPIVDIYFPDAKSVEEVSAVAYGIGNDGNATRDTMAIDQGKLTYNVLTGYFSCLCPFSDCRKWKLYIWRRNGSLNLRDLTWSDGKVIPVSAIISEINQIRQRVKDHTTNIARAIKVPEEGSNDVIIPPKEVRAGKVLGFDSNGNPTTGADCAQVKELLDAGKQCKEAVELAATQVSEAKRQANIAGTHASDCNDSVAECVELLEEAELEANKAKTYAEKAASNGADAVNKARIAANEAMLANEQAQHAKEEVLASKEDVAVKTQDLNKAVCYVACAASNVEKRVEAAKQDIDATKQAAVGEIEAFTDVYKKTETYSKAQLDGVDTGAELTVKMNEIIAMLKDYEAVTGETLPWELWEAVMAEFQRWQANPSEVKEWVTTSATESTNPYFLTPPTKPVVDFNVKLAKSTHSLRVPSFNPNTNVDVYLPSATNINDIMSFSTKRVGRIIAPNAAYADYLIGGNNEEYTETIYLKNAVSIRYIANSAQKFNGKVIAKKAKDVTGAFYLAYAYSKDTRFESADNCFALLSNAIEFAGTLEVPLCQRADRIVERCKKFNHSVYLPLCSTAKDGFKDTAMSAENISVTLDSLPTWTDGASHVITFTGSTGASDLTQDSPSVAAAVAKGWTVEL